MTRRSAALDGLRGFALVGMLGWHAQLTWLRGGFARMTIFFVLAGFLAARSYERRRADGAHHPFLAFWSRRARRLLPVTILGVLWALLATVIAGSDHARATARGDTISVLLSVANWRFVVDERPYGALFDAPSAFQHYWSLSLEEQCFVVLPLVIAVVTLGGRIARRGAIVAALIVAAVAFGALPFVVDMAPDTVYYGTHVRLGEFLAGVALAFALREHDVDAITARTRRAIGAVGAVSLVILLVTILTIDREQSWLYRGGMGLFAVPTVAVIAAASVGAPAVTRVLGILPLRVLGRWAFSVYVVHWPLYQVLDQELASWPRGWLVVFEMSAAVVIGAIVHYAVERPLMNARFGRPTGAMRVWANPRVAFAVLATVAVGAVALASAIRVPEPVLDFAAAEREAEATAIPDVDAAWDVLRGAELGGLPYHRDEALLGVASFGGSTGLMLELGKWAWVDEHTDVQGVPGYAFIGCGLLTDGVRGVLDPTQVALDPGLAPARPPDDRCIDWHEFWAATVIVHRVDIAVLVPSQWDLREWRFDGDDQWRTVGDPVVDARLETAMAEAADLLHDAGAGTVVFLTPSPYGSDDGEERAAAYEAVLYRVAAQRPFVQVVDLGAWLRGLPDERRDEIIPDGVHPSREAAGVIWAEFLGPALETQVAAITTQ